MIHQEFLVTEGPATLVFYISEVVIDDFKSHPGHCKVPAVTDKVRTKQ